MSENAQKILRLSIKFVHYFRIMWYNYMHRNSSSAHLRRTPMHESIPVHLMYLMEIASGGCTQNAKSRHFGVARSAQPVRRPTVRIRYFHSKYYSEVIA